MTVPTIETFRLAREILDAEPVPRRTRAELREIAFAMGAWACPACPDGWEQYMIATDMHVCAVCGYKGGPLPQKP